MNESDQIPIYLARLFYLAASKWGRTEGFCQCEVNTSKLYIFGNLTHARERDWQDLKIYDKAWNYSDRVLIYLARLFHLAAGKWGHRGCCQRWFTSRVQSRIANKQRGLLVPLLLLISYYDSKALVTWYYYSPCVFTWLENGDRGPGTLSYVISVPHR